mmetsp:Transcript_36150/g.88319  ORF Transcript_36150/g.88319 Transcript_36150/m.88319 type:complete len:698 (+) Transcript_36150:196-2289(+)
MAGTNGYGAGLDDYRRRQGGGAGLNPYESFHRGNEGMVGPSAQVMSYEEDMGRSGSVSARDPALMRATVMVDEATERGVSEEKANKVRVELISMALESNHGGDFVAGAIRQRLKAMDVVTVLNTLTLLDELMRTCPYFYRHIANDRFFRRLWRFVNPNYKDGVKVLFKTKTEMRSMDVAQRVLVLWRAWAETLQKMYAGKYEPAAAYIIERYQNKRMKVKFPDVPPSDIPWVCIPSERNREKFRQGGASSTQVSIEELETTVDLLGSMLDSATSAREVQESDTISDLARRCRDIQMQLDNLAGGVNDSDVARTVVVSEKLATSLQKFEDALEGRMAADESRRYYDSPPEDDIDDPRYVAERLRDEEYEDYAYEEEDIAAEYYEPGPEPERAPQPMRRSDSKKKKKSESSKKSDDKRKKSVKKKTSSEDRSAGSASRANENPIPQMAQMSFYGAHPAQFVSVPGDGAAFPPYAVYSSVTPQQANPPGMVPTGMTAQYANVDPNACLSVNPVAFNSMSSNPSTAYSTVSSAQTITASPGQASTQIVPYQTVSSTGSGPGPLVTYHSVSSPGNGQIVSASAQQQGSPPMHYGVVPTVAYQTQHQPQVPYQAQPVQATSLHPQPQGGYGSFAFQPAGPPTTAPTTMAGPPAQPAQAQYAPYPAAALEAPSASTAPATVVPTVQLPPTLSEKPPQTETNPFA